MTITLTKAAPDVRTDLSSYYLNSLRNGYEIQNEQRKAELARAWEKAVRDDNLRKLRLAHPKRSSMIENLQNVLRGIFAGFEYNEGQKPGRSAFA